jgi:hypothetical protein
MRFWLCRKEHSLSKMPFQRPASRRLMPIKAPREATNLMAAAVNVGATTGEKAGAATVV